MLDSLTPTADLKDIQMSFEVTAPATTITGDTILLHGALRNLLDNAIKYSPDDSAIAVTVSAGEGSEICVTVCDRGRGLAGASQKQLSGRFSRGGNVSDIVGSGLGLTIVEDVARTHNGRFILETNGDKGTCASLILPLS